MAEDDAVLSTPPLAPKKKVSLSPRPGRSEAATTDDDSQSTPRTKAKKKVSSSSNSRSPRPGKMKSPKTPLQTLGSKQGSKSKLPLSPNTPRHSLKLPLESERMVVYVYEKPKGDKDGSTINNVPNRIQGVWQDGYQCTVSPTQLWIFETEHTPNALEGSKHIHGVWGYHPESPTHAFDADELNKANPKDIWFYPPNAKLPKYFTPRGAWTYPLVKKDITQLAPEESGFLKVAESVKTHKLDVAGSWKMLYKRDSEQDIKGPGMKKKSSKPKPKPLRLTVMDGKTEIPLEAFANDTILSVKLKIHDKHGIPPQDQTLLFNREILDDTPTLNDYGIVNGSILELDAYVVYVKHWDDDKKQIKVPCDASSTTIKQLQTKVEEQNLGQIEPSHLHRMVYNGQVLTDTPTKTLEELGIPNKSVLELEPMEISVKTPQGQIVTLSPVDPHESMERVSRQVERLTGIPMDEQRLLFQGKPCLLKNDNNHALTLQDYGIQHGDVVELEGMQVYVEDWNGNTFEVDVDPSEMLFEVKTKIWQQQQIQIPHQRLSYQGRILSQDKTTLREFKIPHKATLVLEPMEISVKTTTGKLIIGIEVKPTDTVDSIKPKIFKLEGIPVEDQRLTFQGKHLGGATTLSDNRICHGSQLDLEPMEVKVRDTQTGVEFSIAVHPDDTIAQLKDKIQEEEGIPLGKQRLAFHGKPLNAKGGKTLRDYGIGHHDVLENTPMQIHAVTPDGKKLTLNVDLDDTLNDVKKQVYELEGIPIDEQQFDIEDEDNADGVLPKKTLEDYGVKHGDTLGMGKMTIKVIDWKGNEYPIRVDSASEKLGDVKWKIEDASDCPVPYQRLFFDGTALEDNDKQLKDYGIKHKDILNLEAMQIHVSTPEGKKMTFAVEPVYTIDTIKEMVKDASGIPKSKQRLVFGKRELPNDRTLMDSGIKHGSSLDLEGMQITIKDWDNKRMTLDVDPDDTLATIKTKINEAREGDLPPEKQYLHFEKELMEDDGMTLEEYGVPHKGTINLDKFRVFVQTPRGKISLNIDPSGTLDDIKDKVEERVGMTKDKQHLLYQGKPLPYKPKSTLAECGIEYKDTIEVEVALVSPKTTKPKVGEMEEVTPDVPEYTVKVGPWQSPFDYKPKPKVKREGVRARPKVDKLGKFYDTQVMPDAPIGRFGDNLDGKEEGSS